MPFDPDPSSLMVPAFVVTKTWANPRSSPGTKEDKRQVSARRSGMLPSLNYRRGLRRASSAGVILGLFSKAGGYCPPSFVKTGTSSTAFEPEVVEQPVAAGFIRCTNPHFGSLLGPGARGDHGSRAGRIGKLWGASLSQEISKLVTEDDTSSSRQVGGDRNFKCRGHRERLVL